MVNTIDSKTGKLVRWESYERDKDNMTVSKWKDYYIVLSFGAKKTRSKAKEIPVRQYRVWKEDGEVKCNCPSAEKGEFTRKIPFQNTALEGLLDQLLGILPALRP